MNLKQAFYKDYYQGIDFRKYVEKDGVVYGKETSIENHNERQFKDNNQPLFNYSFHSKDYTTLDLSSYQLAGYTTIPLATTYPGLVTGLGMVHETNNKAELKLGFFFDHTSGMPMLPGSGVKGALRAAFPQFKAQKGQTMLPDLEGDKGREKKKAKAEFIQAIFPPFADLEGVELYTKVHQLELAIFAGVDISKKIAKPDKDPYLPMTKRCRFFDAIIARTNNEGNRILGIDALTPHGKNLLKNPIPLPFLKVLPGVVFNFQFVLQPLELDSITIDALAIEALFKQVLLFLGVGAKTNVGYGQFTSKLPGAIENGPRPPKQTKRLDTNITAEHLAKLQYHKEDYKNRYEATINDISEDEYQLQLLADCVLTKNRKTVDNKFQKDSEKRKKRGKPFVFKVLSIGDKVMIRLNEPKEGQQIVFSILPIWI